MTIGKMHPTLLSIISISIPVSTVISKCDGTSSVETNFSWSVWIWRTFSLVKSSSKKLSEFKCSEFCNSLLSLYLIIKWRESYHEFYTGWIMNGYVAENYCSMNLTVRCNLHHATAVIVEPISLLNRSGPLRNGYWTGGFDDFPRFFMISKPNLNIFLNLGSKIRIFRFSRLPYQI